MANLTQKEQCRQSCTWWGAGIGLAAGLLLWLIFGWGFLVSLLLAVILGALSIFVLLRQVCDKTSSSEISSHAPASTATQTSATNDPADTGSSIDGVVPRIISGNPIATSEPISMAANSESVDTIVDTSSSIADEPAVDEPAVDEPTVDDPVLDDAPIRSTTDAGTASAPVGGAAREATAGTSPAAKSEKSGFSGIKPTATLKGQQELATRKGSYKYAAPKPEVAETEAAPIIADTTRTVSQEIAPSHDTEAKPVTLDAPRANGADDLKLISGVGPKMEQTLNELGIYHFDQIAQWGPQEIAWVDARLRFKGRIQRDNWVAQSATLAAGGDTQLSTRTK